MMRVPSSSWTTRLLAAMGSYRFCYCLILLTFLCDRPVAAFPIGERSGRVSVSSKLPNYRSRQLCSSTTGHSTAIQGKHGLYKDTAQSITQKLLNTGWVQIQQMNNTSVPVKQLLPEEHVVKLTAEAFRKDNMYARIALLETLSAGKDEDLQTHHIQVLNAVIVPDLASSDLPVWGADLVRLPSNKDLILLDAQPIATLQSSSYHLLWQDWYNAYEIDQLFPYGGDMPSQVQKFVSPYALWTRLQDIEDPTALIQTELFDALDEHLNIYLRLLEKKYSPNKKPNCGKEYLEYRKENDPAKPMLKALYGEDFTSKLLNLLFPDTL